MAGSLVQVATNTVTSAVSSVQLIGTTTDDIYKVVTSGISTVGTAATDINGRFINSSGSIVTTSSYDYAHFVLYTDGTTGNVADDDDDKFKRIFGDSADQAPEDTGSVVWFFNPYNSSLFTYALYQSMSASTGVRIFMKGISVFNTVGSMSGFQVIDGNGSRPFAGGQIKTYGLRVDS